MCWGCGPLNTHGAAWGSFEIPGGSQREPLGWPERVPSDAPENTDIPTERSKTAREAEAGSAQGRY
eukprot:4099657-Pyramimonas_sp.AAC.1